MLRSVALTALSATLLACPALLASESTASEWKLKETRKIWDKADHSAFTDLIRFKDHWYVSFRESTGHHSRDGRQRVIRSADGVTWESVAHMAGEKPDHDVRDPMLSITPDEQLMINGFIVYPGEKEITRESLTWFSPDGIHWSERHHCPTGQNSWRWKVRWHNGTAYSLAYNGKDIAGTFYRSSDGKKWEVVAENVFPTPQNEEEQKWKARGNESDLYFEEDGSVIALVRRDAFGEDGKPNYAADVPGSSAMLGFSKPPYTDWSWKDLGIRIGGPKMIRLSDGRFVSVVRLYDRPLHSALLIINPEKGTAEKVLRFPTSGDTGYAGLAEYEGELWVSYYSSHEGHSAIYLARVEIPKAL